jgi:DNA recombination protein RmuC
LVELSLRQRVLLASPTTLWAILTTAAAMLKDAETRKQVHIIQDELRKLAKEFHRFEDRWDKLATHIQQASRDVDQVSISAKKITSKFDRIERLELEDGEKQLEAGLLENPPG